jgi:hypothetical protein
MGLKIKLERAKTTDVSSEFVFVGSDPDRLPDYAGTGATRECSGEDGHTCTVDRDFWIETVKEKGQKITRSKVMPIEEAIEHCKASTNCVEKALLEKKLLCTKTVDLVKKDGQEEEAEEPHVHGDSCDRTPSVQEELGAALNNVVKFEEAKKGEADLLARKA